jgi:hypothetical protein
MQIRNRIIYPSLLVLFMGLHFSSNAIACGGPGSPPCEPDIQITTPDAVTPPIPTFEIPEDMRKNLEDKLKSTNKQIETIQEGIAKFCPSASDPEQCKLFDTELAALQLEKEGIQVGLGDEIVIFKVDADNLAQEYVKLRKKYLDTIKEVSSGKSGNLDAVLAELQERLDELNDRRDNLFDEYLENEADFIDVLPTLEVPLHQQAINIASMGTALDLYLKGEPYAQAFIDWYAQMP